VEGPGPACSAMALGNPTRAKNSYFRRVRSAQLFRLFSLRTNEGALRNSWRPILTRMVSRDVSRMTTWVSRRLMEVNRTCWTAYVRWTPLSPSGVQSPLSLAKCNADLMSFVFFYSRKMCTDATDNWRNMRVRGVTFPTAPWRAFDRR
jgi:hypothetical protein